MRTSSIVEALLAGKIFKVSSFNMMSADVVVVVDDDDVVWY